MASRFLLNVLLSAGAFIAGFGAAKLTPDGARHLASHPQPSAPDLPAAEAGVADANASANLPHTPVEMAQRFEAILSETNYYRQNKALAMALRDLQPEDVEPALASVGNGEGEKQERFKAAIIERWADFDPAAAAGYALNHLAPFHPSTSRVIAASFEKWAARDEGAAVREAAAIDDATRQRAAVRGAIVPFIQRDPGASLQWLQTLPASVRDREFYRAAFGAWGRKDPEAAAQSAMTIADAGSRGMALAGVAGEWVASAPHAAAAWAASLPDPAQRTSAQGAIFRSWAYSDPLAAAAAAAPLLPRDAQPPQFFSSILDGLIEWDAPAALEFARTSADGEEGTRRWIGAIAQAAFQDPVAALAGAKKMPPGEPQCEILKEIFRYLPQVDSPEDAVQFAIRELPQGPVRDQVVGEGLRSWMGYGGGQAAMNFAVAQSNLTSSTVTSAFEMWSMVQPDAALAWARARPDGAEKEAFIGMGLPHLAKKFPEEAARLLPQSPPEARSQMIGDIASGWSATDPASAIAWAGQLADSGERTVAWQKLTENWSATQPVEAAAWLKTLPPGADRDAAAAAYARTVLGIDPDAAVAWAGSIGDPAQRDAALRKAYIHWRQFDPEAAGHWLEGIPHFTAEAKQSLQNVH